MSDSSLNGNAGSSPKVGLERWGIPKQEENHHGSPFDPCTPETILETHSRSRNARPV